MHETYIHTIFEPSAKKHLPFFSCFVKKKIHLLKERSLLVTRLMKLYFLKLTSCLSTCSFWWSIFRRSAPYSILESLMQYDVWCDVMRKDVDAEDTHPHAHTGTHKLCIPLGTTFELLHLLFRWCKFCIPLGTSFELLRLLFWRYKFCIPLGTTFELLRLLFRWYLALHSLWNNFWAKNLRCAPLGATFCSYGNLGSAFP
jgi:hypothetical protein